MKTAHDIIENVGVDAICERLGIKTQAVYKARRNGVLPAPWYAALSDMVGHDLPRHLFSFKGVAPDAFKGPSI